MDDLDFLANIYFCLAQSQPIEQRLKSVLEKIEINFPIKTAFIIFRIDDDPIFYISNNKKSSNDISSENNISSSHKKNNKNIYLMKKQFKYNFPTQNRIFSGISEPNYRESYLPRESLIENRSIENLALHFHADPIINNSNEVRMTLTLIKNYKLDVFNKNDIAIIHQLILPIRSAINQELASAPNFLSLAPLH